MLLLSPSARRLVTAVAPSAELPEHRYRLVASDPGAAERRQLERRARSFRKRAAKWFGVAPPVRPTAPKPAPVDPYTFLPVDPDTDKQLDPSKLPIPRLPSADLEFLHTEAGAALGARGTLASTQGALERGGTSGVVADTWPYIEAAHHAIDAVARLRKVEALWRQVPPWWQDALTAYYSTARLAPKLARTREDKAAYKRANALQGMLETARIEKLAAWLRAIGSPLDAGRVALDAHKLWEWVRHQRLRRWAEGPQEAL